MDEQFTLAKPANANKLTVTQLAPSLEQLTSSLLPEGSVFDLFHIFSSGNPLSLYRSTVPLRLHMKKMQTKFKCETSVPFGLIAEAKNTLRNRGVFNISSYSQLQLYTYIHEDTHRRR